MDTRQEYAEQSLARLVTGQLLLVEQGPGQLLQVVVRLLSSQSLAGQAPEQLLLAGQAPGQLLLAGQAPGQLLLAGQAPDQVLLAGQVVERLLAGQVVE
jgi:hypothetical protein